MLLRCHSLSPTVSLPYEVEAETSYVKQSLEIGLHLKHHKIINATINQAVPTLPKYIYKILIITLPQKQNHKSFLAK